MSKLYTTPLKNAFPNTIGDGPSGKGKELAKGDGWGGLDLSKRQRQVQWSLWNRIENWISDIRLALRRAELD